MVPFPGRAQTSPPDNLLQIHTPKKAPKVTYLSRTPTHSFRLNTPPNSPPKSAPKRLTSQSTLPSSFSMESVDPFSPQKPAKDLSSLFYFSQNQSPSKSASKTRVGDGGGIGGTTGSGSGVAKRMLSRSRTESSFDSPSQSQGSSRSVASLSSHSNSSLTPKNHTTPSSRSPSPSKILAPPLPVPAPIPSTPTSTTTTHARTYAGTSRSFLISLPASSLPSGPGLSVERDLDPLAQAQAQEDSETRESYTDLRTRWGVDNSEDDPCPRPNNSPSPSPSNPESRSQSPTKHFHSTKGKGKEKEQIIYPNGLANDLKSITELRSKGESRRFLDEVGYLFEGMEPSGGIGVRRARYSSSCMHLRS
jgi:hypothetical protein